MEEETVIMHMIVVIALAGDIFNAHDSNVIVGHWYCEDKSTEHIKH